MYSPQPNQPSPSHVSLFVILWRTDEALRLATTFPAARIALFVESWSDVDLARRRAQEAGASDRISIHHAAARRGLKN
jgi:hypothetical protein